jgi:NAD(P)-dependent dehydrogenase (short-subunit alcohol dehydrogenase family)
MDIRGAVTVITGGGSGIGRALARAMAREGADVIIADIDLAAAEAVAGDVRALGRRALAVRCDVGQEAEVAALIRRTLDEFGRIDIFVSNAGVLLSGPVEQVTDADWRWIMDINFYAHVYAVRHVLPHMLARDHGCLVHVASAAGLIETGTNIPYHVSKHAVVALAGGLAIDLKARGANVGVSVVCPEVVNTNLPLRSFTAGEIGRDLTAAEQAAHDEETRAMLARMAQRGLDPDEAARAIVAGIRADRYLIYTHERTHAIVAGRAADPEQGIADAVRVLQREQERMRAFTEQVRGG